MTLFSHGCKLIGMGSDLSLGGDILRLDRRFLRDSPHIADIIHHLTLLFFVNIVVMLCSVCPGASHTSRAILLPLLNARCLITNLILLWDGRDFDYRPLSHLFGWGFVHDWL